MSYTLIIGPKNYSSWSLRPWLVLKHLALPFEELPVALYAGAGWKERLLSLNPAGKVPALRDGELLVHETLAICEYLAERHPEAGLWPADLVARARARAFSQEMASGFFALRNELPMNCRGRAKAFTPSEAAVAEIERVAAVWEDCRTSAATGGPFLFGAFGIVDAMYAPVALRFITYGVQLSGAAGEYADTLLALESVQQWMREGEQDESMPDYDGLLYT